MSFATFGPLPTPPQNPIPGLPALEAAIRRLEATTFPTPASRDAGGTGSSIWLLLERLLAQIDADARCYVRRVFERALEAAETELALPPERRRLAPVPFLVQHWGRPRFQPEEPREQNQAGLDRLLRLALWRAVDALEAAALLAPGEVYLSILAEQCAQFERVYQVLKRRAGRYFALAIFEGEIRLLRRHRGSATAERLLFS
jgi:hypothetical protein